MGLNLVAAIVILRPSVPPIIRAMFSIPNVALQNVMACRVYRQLKIGLIRESAPVILTSRVSGMQFNSRTVTGTVTREQQTQIRSHISLSNLTAKAKNAGPVHVDIDREVEVTVDEVSSHGSGWKGGEFA